MFILLRLLARSHDKNEVVFPHAPRGYQVPVHPLDVKDYVPVYGSVGILSVKMKLPPQCAHVVTLVWWIEVGDKGIPCSVVIKVVFAFFLFPAKTERK